jgi:hypothetical protein
VAVKVIGLSAACGLGTLLAKLVIDSDAVLADADDAVEITYGTCANA